MPTVTKSCPRHPKFQRHPPPIWGQAPFKAIKSRVKWGLSPEDGPRRAREQPLRHGTRVRHHPRHFVTLWLFCDGQTGLPSNVRSRSWQLAHHANAASCDRLRGSAFGLGQPDRFATGACRRAVPLRMFLTHAPLARPSAVARFFS